MMIKSSKSKSVYFAVALAVLLLVGGVFVYLEKSGVTNFIGPAKNTNEPTKAQLEDQKAVEQDQKQDFIEDDNSVATPDPEAPSSMELTARQESNGNVTVLTKLYGISDGECSLTATNGAATFTQTVPVIYQPEFSSCAGFTIQKDKLGTGEWAIFVSPTSDPSAGKTITTRVN